MTDVMQDAVRVKPLEWKESTRKMLPYGHPSPFFRAVTTFDWGYRIEGLGEQFKMEGVLYSTLEAAKAAAQADYEARIRSALLPPVPVNSYEEMRAALEWRPIETAPKDGTEILTWSPGRSRLRALICPCAWHPDAGFCVDELRSPTHWMPLPVPPAALDGVQP